MIYLLMDSKKIAMVCAISESSAKAKLSLCYTNAFDGFDLYEVKYSDWNVL